VRFTVFGAGAIGGVIGARLFQSGRDVRLVARGRHAEVIDRSGLRLRSPEGDVVLPIPVVDSGGGLDRCGFEPDEVVVLAVKSDATVDVIDRLTAVAPASIAIVCAQNGVENERVALRSFAAVQGVCVMMPAEHLEPGVVAAHASPVPGLLDVGRYPSGIDDDSWAVAEALGGAGFESVPRPDIMRWKYAKLLMNLGNVLEAASGRDGAAREIASRARREARACFDAAGIAPTPGDEERARRGDRLQIGEIDGAPRGGGSTWQSVVRSTGRIETEYLNGEIVLLGRLHGVPTPVNEYLVQLGRDLVATGAPAGSVDAADLLARLDG
jgi:2-dehydropantoate 2-reductase